MFRIDNKYQEYDTFNFYGYEKKKKKRKSYFPII